MSYKYRAGSCTQWSPNTNWLPSTFSVQDIVTEYIVLEGDWVGEGEGDWGCGHCVCVCHRSNPVVDLPDMYMLNEEPTLESR